MWPQRVVAWIACMASWGIAEESGRAFVVVHETVKVGRTVAEAADWLKVGDDIVVGAAGQNLTILVSLLNVGEAKAKDIKLRVPRWPSEKFNILHGTLDETVPELGPSAGVKREIIVQPLHALRLSADEMAVAIEYKDSGNGAMVRHGRGVGVEVHVMSAEQFWKLTGSFLTEWTRYVLFATCTWAIPMVVWLSAQKTFQENIDKLN